MKRMAPFLSCCLLFTGNFLIGQQVLISEIHYDNSGADVNEGIEITGLANTDLTGWRVILYNGNGNMSYGTITLSGTIVDDGSGFGALSFPKSSIQNGSPDGLALVDNSNNVIEFISYEGTFTAVGGPADGLTSSDIGVAESSSTFATQSLQRTGLSSWAPPAASNFGTTDARLVSALPIELSYFRAIYAPPNVQIEWQTASETNNEYFSLQHSNDARNFVKLVRIPGAGTTYKPQNYSYNDSFPSPRFNYYRLKQTDFDGTSTFSPIVSAFVLPEEEVAVRPTLATESLELEFKTLQEFDTKATICNSNGQIIQTTIIPAGSTNYSLKIDNLACGNYFLKLQSCKILEVIQFVKM